MKWRNTRLDKLPRDNQEVLLSKNGINYISIYSGKEKSFAIEENGREKIISADEDQLYWTDYSRPGRKNNKP